MLWFDFKHSFVEDRTRQWDGHSRREETHLNYFLTTSMRIWGKVGKWMREMVHIQTNMNLDPVKIIASLERSIALLDTPIELANCSKLHWRPTLGRRVGGLNYLLQFTHFTKTLINPKSLSWDRSNRPRTVHNGHLASFKLVQAWLCRQFCLIHGQ